MSTTIRILRSDAVSETPRLSGQLRYDIAGEGAEKSPAGAEPCVLVVDDDPDITRLIKAALATRGVGCIAAYDAMQGFIVAQRHRPTLVLVDWHMPAGGGQLLIRKLHHHTPTKNIPVYVVTGDTSPAIDTEATSQGAKGVLRKPIDPMQLLDLLAPHLSGPDKA